MFIRENWKIQERRKFGRKHLDSSAKERWLNILVYIVLSINIYFEI